MHFGFVLDSSDIDLRNIDLLDAHLDLLVTDIPGKYFVYLQDILKTSSRYVFKTSSRHVFKTSSRHVFKTSSRHVFKTSSKHVFKTSSRHVFKTSWRRLQRNNSKTSRKMKNCYTDGKLKTKKCLLGSYHNRWCKSYITSLKAVIVGKSLISAQLDIDRILYSVFYDKILQLYRQHWVRKFKRHILSKFRHISKRWRGVTSLLACHALGCFPSLSQRPTWNPVKHLWWSFLRK